VSGIPEVQIAVDDEKESKEPNDPCALGLQGLWWVVVGFFREYSGHWSLSQLELERCLVQRYYTGVRGEVR
jgi:hypothetical protein